MKSGRKSNNFENITKCQREITEIKGKSYRFDQIRRSIKEVQRKLDEFQKEIKEIQRKITEDL